MHMRTGTTFLLLATWICASAQPGTVDTTFHSHLLPDSGEIRCVLALPDGKALIGGSLTMYDGVPVGRIARLLPDGTLDARFMSGTGFDASVRCLVRQTNGKILVGGSFTTYNGLPRAVLIRLEADGGVDNTFQPEVSDLHGMHHLAVLPTGRVLVSGWNWPPNPFIGLRRLLPDGSLDATFSAPEGIWPAFFTVLNNGRIVVGESGPPATCLSRLLSDGSIDASFASGDLGGIGLSHPVVHVIHPLQDGSYIVGGQFESYNGIARKSLLRVLPDGTLDGSYDPVDASWTNTPIPWTDVTTIQPCTDGRLMIPKFGFNTRLLEDGAQDTEFHRAIAPFNFDPRLAFITGSARQPDGKILIAGTFDDIDSTGNRGIARLNDCVIGSPCDDGNTQTINDVVDTLCNCTGELFTAIVDPVDEPNGMMVVPHMDGSGRFTIIGAFTGDPGLITVTLHDMLGRKVHDEQVMLNDGPVRIEVSPASGTSPGNHLVSLTGERFRWTQRLLLP